MRQHPRVLIMSENASMQFGGESALPLHYFQGLRKRGVEVWLLTHERTQEELKELFPEDFSRIHFTRDTAWNQFLWQLRKFMPSRAHDILCGMLVFLMNQVVQRRLARELIRKYQINVVHQPIPVSPKSPSLLLNLGAPIVIGPMNGGMDYPDAFQYLQKGWVTLLVKTSRFFSDFIHTLMPGKLKAETLLVANQRTRKALPKSIQGRVIELVENGVDLAIWQKKWIELGQITKPNSNSSQHSEDNQPVKFVFVGRLVDWKAVDFLLHAFRRVVDQLPAELEIIGDGIERASLERQAQQLNLLKSGSSSCEEVASDRKNTGCVCFTGWLAQEEVAKRLQSADVFVLPSLMECGGSVVLEAMAMKLPVIATQWGGPTDYLNESCGILVEPSSPDAFIEGLAAAMMRLARSHELRQSMGEAGQKRVLNYFSWDSKLTRILEIYQETIHRTEKQPISVLFSAYGHEG